MTDSNADSARADAQRFRETYESIRAEVSRRMVGQTDVIEGVLTALLAGGHVLLEGVPGLGKTMLVSSLGEALKLSLFHETLRRCVNPPFFQVRADDSNADAPVRLSEVSQFLQHRPNRNRLVRSWFIGHGQSSP